jgi:hypothetical protein
MVPIESLSVGKKVSIFFQDQSFMEVDALTAAKLLDGTEIKIPVTLEPGSLVLDKLAKVSGWVIERNEDGIFLVGPLSTPELRRAYIKMIQDPGPHVEPENPEGDWREWKDAAPKKEIAPKALNPKKVKPPKVSALKKVVESVNCVESLVNESEKVVQKSVKTPPKVDYSSALMKAMGL